MILLLLTAALLEYASLKDQLSYISYHCRPDRRGAEPGQPFAIVSVITNRRRLPVAYLRLEEILPADLTLVAQGLSLHQEATGLSHHSTLFLRPREVVTRQVRASLPARGRYLFRGATLYAGDFFGLQERGRTFHQTEEIVIYPAPARQAALPAIMSGFLGQHSVRRFIMEDPILTLGFREYTGREPQKAISWTQSLQKGRMMVKQYDYTQDSSVTVVLNVDCGRGLRREPDLLEAAFSLTRSVCRYLEDKKIRYSFLTNATTAGAAGGWRLLAEGLGSRHFYTILEGLGRATYDHTESWTSLLERAAKRAEQGQAHIILTPCPQPGLQTLVHRLEALTGCPSCLLNAADDSVLLAGAMSPGKPAPFEEDWPQCL